MVLLPNAPIPPSVNAAYCNIPSRGRVASQALREYKRAFASWALLNARLFSQAQTLISQSKFSLSLIFKLPETTLYTKMGAPKRWDVSNRIKVLEDCVCTKLGIDDKWVFNVSACKIGGASVGLVDIVITPMT